MRGQTRQNLGTLYPKRDCSAKRVKIADIPNNRIEVFSEITRRDKPSEKIIFDFNFTVAPLTVVEKNERIRNDRTPGCELNFFLRWTPPPRAVY